MNKLAMTVVLLFFSILGYGQQVRTVYFDAKDVATTDSTKIASYGIYGKVSGSNLWVFKKFDLDNYLMVTGAYKDDELRIPQGKFVYYDWVDNGNSYVGIEATIKGRERYVVLSGNFENGLRQGRWTSYYEDGEVKTIATYENGVLQGEYKSFSHKGDVDQSGSFVNNKKEGVWHVDGGRRVVTFKDDQIVSDVKLSKRDLKQKAQIKQ